MHQPIFLFNAKNLLLVAEICFGEVGYCIRFHIRIVYEYRNEAEPEKNAASVKVLRIGSLFQFRYARGL